MEETQPTKPQVDWMKIRSVILKKRPNLTKTQLAKLDDALSRRANQQLVSGGDMSLADLAAKDPISAASLQAQGIRGSKELGADGQKRQAALDSALPVLKRVAGSALLAPEGLFGFGAATAGKIPGVEGGEAEFLDRQTDGFARLIANTFASEVGVATEEDVKRWKAIMPQPKDTLNERIRIMEDLLTQIRDESKAKGIKTPKLIDEIQISIDVAKDKKSKKKGLIAKFRDLFSGAASGGVQPYQPSSGGNTVGRFQVEVE